MESQEAKHTHSLLVCVLYTYPSSKGRAHSGVACRRFQGFDALVRHDVMVLSAPLWGVSRIPRIQIL